MAKTLQEHAGHPTYWAAAASLAPDQETALAYLKEAAKLYPDCPAVLSALVSAQMAAGRVDESTLAYASELARLDPTNALGDCYAAQCQFQRGDVLGALQSLAQASAKGRFTDDRIAMLMARRDYFLDEGLSDPAALGLSAFTLPLEHLSMIRELGNQSIEQANALLAAGRMDNALKNAQDVANIGKTVSSSGRFLIHDRVGITLQQAGLTEQRQIYQALGDTARVQETDAMLQAVRAILGAGRWRLVRQSLVESLCLSATGGILGVFLAWWGKGVLQNLLPRLFSRVFDTPQYAHFDVRADPVILMFTLGCVLATALLVGLLPGLLEARVNPGTRLGSTRVRGTPRARIGKALVVAQIAMSLILVVGTGLLLHSLVNLYRIELGFDPKNLLVFHLNAAQAGYEDPKRTQFYEEVNRAMAALPGVRSTAFADQCHIGAGCRRRFSNPSAGVPGFIVTGTAAAMLEEDSDATSSVTDHASSVPYDA
jgi:hypothetical protein